MSYSSLKMWCTFHMCTLSDFLLFVNEYCLQILTQLPYVCKIEEEGEKMNKKSPVNIDYLFDMMHFTSMWRKIQFRICPRICTCVWVFAKQYHWLSCETQLMMQAQSVKENINRLWTTISCAKIIIFFSSCVNVWFFLIKSYCCSESWFLSCVQAALILFDYKTEIFH